MKFWKKGLTAAALLAVAAVTLTACGGSSEKKATEKSEDGKTKLISYCFFTRFKLCSKRIRFWRSGNTSTRNHRWHFSIYH